MNNHDDLQQALVSLRKLVKDLETSDNQNDADFQNLYLASKRLVEQLTDLASSIEITDQDREMN